MRKIALAVISFQANTVNFYALKSKNLETLIENYVYLQF